MDSLSELVPNSMYGDSSLDSIIVDPTELSAFTAFDPTHIDPATEELIRQDKN